MVTESGAIIKSCQQLVLRKGKAAILTKESRYEADTVGQHGTLDGVKLG